MLQENREVLPSILRDSLADSETVYGRRTELLSAVEGPEGGKRSLTWEKWLQEPEEEDLRASVMLSRHQVLSSSKEQLIQQIIQTYERLYPLVLLAATDDPMPAIEELHCGTSGPAPDRGHRWSRRDRSVPSGVRV
jgi:hypothetical protein